MKLYLILGVILLTLTGCGVTDGTIASLAPVCDALSANADPGKPGPIRYTSTNTKSLRYAGKALAPDLATRNRVGIKLNCPNF